MKSVHAQINPTTPVALHVPTGSAEHITLVNEGGVVVYVGGPSVSLTTGLALPPGSKVILHRPQSTVYAIAPAGFTAALLVEVGAL